MERAPGTAVVIGCLLSACFRPTFEGSTCRAELGACPDAPAEVGDDAGPPDIDADIVDAVSVDVPPVEPIGDAGACYGTILSSICLPAPPVAILTIDSALVLDTDSSFLCEVRTSHSEYCVVIGTTISINARLRATGSRPLVLLASEAIAADGLIDVGSHRAGQPETGAGADPTACFGAGATPPASSGGGAGGSFAGTGGGGGPGQGAGGQPGNVVEPTVLRGGCAGQPGQGASGGGAPGHGGGAVLLIAGSEITSFGGINAAGESGGGGTTVMSGGGGGGAGGMIVLDAPRVVTAGLILATGGGGGEGSDDVRIGNRGADPSSVAPATGGSGGTLRGGVGGDGAAVATAGAGNPGAIIGSTRAGGGGGGGGVGFVKAPPTADLGPDVAPAVSYQ